jgi:hypothetical protein
MQKELNDFLTTISTLLPRTPTMISSANFAIIERSSSVYDNALVEISF